MLSCCRSRCIDFLSYCLDEGASDRLRSVHNNSCKMFCHIFIWYIWFIVTHSFTSYCTYSRHSLIYTLFRCFSLYQAEYLYLAEYLLWPLPLPFCLFVLLSRSLSLSLPFSLICVRVGVSVHVARLIYKFCEIHNINIWIVRKFHELNKKYSLCVCWQISNRMCVTTRWRPTWGDVFALKLNFELFALKCAFNVS